MIPENVVSWIEETVGGTMKSATRMAGGGRKQAWFVDVETADGLERVFLRWDPTEIANDAADPWTIGREAAMYRALQGSGVPHARFIDVHPSAPALLLGLLSGTAAFSALRDDGEREQIAAEFMGHLATLHRLDPRQIGLLGADDAVAVPELVRQQLAEVAAIVDARGGPAEPLLALALDWLHNNVPDYDGPIVVVQGDTGPGNFMFDAGQITGIVDWELAHLGDPMDDLAWVSLRAVQEPFTDLRTRFAEYAAASDHSLDADRIRYYRVLAEAKILVMSHGRAVDDGSDPGARLVFGQLHHRLCAEALADVMDIELDGTISLRPPAPTGDDALFDVVLDQLRHIVLPRVDDSFAQQRLKGLARVVKYLAASSQFGGDIAAEELHDLNAVLHTSMVILNEARLAFADAVRAGTVPFEAALRTMYRQLLRRNELLRSSSGVLADRHYEPL